MKICARCNIEKEDTAFGKSKQQKSGLFPYCYKCCREKHTQYRRKRGIPALKRQALEELPKNKICTRCKKDKPQEQFRIKTEKSGCVGINPTCRECDSEISHIYYHKYKDNPEFKKKNLERVHAYSQKNADEIKARKQTIEFKKKHAGWELNRYHKVKDIIAAKMKIKRQTKEYKKMMRDYRAKNNEKIFQQEMVTKKRYQVKNRDSLSDVYILGVLGLSLKEKNNIRKNAPELIELKREELKFHRLLKQKRET